MDAKTIADKYISRDGGPAMMPDVLAVQYVHVSEKELKWLKKAILRRGWMPYFLRDGDDAPSTRERQSLYDRGLIAGPPWRITKSGREAAKSSGAPRLPPLASITIVGRKLKDVERDLICETLDHCGGNKTQAASLLGISIRTIRNKLNRYADR